MRQELLGRQYGRDFLFNFREQAQPNSLRSRTSPAGCGASGFCLGAEKTRSQCLDKLDNQKRLDAKRAADRASEPQANTAQPKRMSAGTPQRPVRALLGE